MPTLRKAIIPAAGFGTRMLPAAKAVPKELLPILNRPTLQYVVEEAAAAGLSDVLLITSRDKRAMEDHFDRNAELEQRLAASGKETLLASVITLMANLHMHTVRQRQQRGLGDAVLQARQHVGNEPFLCLLGDTVFSGDELPSVQLLAAFQRLGTSVIGLEEVAPEKVDRYGIVAGEIIDDGVLRLSGLVEKPTRESAPSRLAIAARYVLTPGIFACLDETPVGKGGELQLTDALQRLLAREPVHGVVLKARRHDIGNPVDWLKTNLIFARQDAAFWSQLLPLLNELQGKPRE